MLGDPLLCLRLREHSRALADRVATTYVRALYADCRLEGLLPQDPQAAAAVVDNLVVFSQDLWGCTANDPKGFGLSVGAQELSVAEAELLIVIYLDQATIQLQLGTRERERLNVKLHALAEPALTSGSKVFLHSKCVEASGGAAGAAGGGGVANGGAAGEASSGGASAGSAFGGGGGA